MVTTARLFFVITLLGISTHLASAQRSQAQITAGGVTISEPGVYELAELFDHADTVGIVKVVSGDTENYDVAVYKAQVVKSFKGASVGETIYFGPYVGERLGWESVVFLRNAPAPISPKVASGTSYGKVRYARVFNEGYSSMETSYKCIFDGQDVSQKCDHGVRVCTDYIKLPANTRTFPPAGEDTSFGCRWVRKTSLVSLLEALQKARE
jgi:hypothetical protein